MTLTSPVSKSCCVSMLNAIKRSLNRVNASQEKAHDQGILLWNLRRRWVECETSGANVQHLMDRSAFVTGDAAAAAARRDRAMSSHFQGGDPGSVGQAHAMSRLNHGPRGGGAW